MTARECLPPEGLETPYHWLLTTVSSGDDDAQDGLIIGLWDGKMWRVSIADGTHTPSAVGLVARYYAPCVPPEVGNG